MPWTVQIEDEDGCPQAERHATIEFALIFSLPGFELLPSIAASTLLKYLDPWGDTLFNRLQMGELRREWVALTPPESESQAWKEVTEMIDICLAGTHLYLRFIGD